MELRSIQNIFRLDIDQHVLATSQLCTELADEHSDAKPVAVMSCCVKLLSGIVTEYQVPFYDCVGNDPSFDEMLRVVCIERRRPEIPNRWNTDVIIAYCAYKH